MATVEINQVGPIESLEIPVPEGGGVCVLRGSNGCGKSIAIDTAQRLLGGKARPAASDGADKGTADGWGARLTVAQRITRSGTLEASSLEGSFDLASLVDPGIEDPVAADNKRTKALLSLLGIRADESMFAPRLVSKMMYDSLGVAPGDDLVEMAGRVKRKLEEGARTFGKSAENHRTKASALVAAGEEFAADVERDAEKLQKTLEAVISEKARLTEQTDSVRNRIVEQEQARTKLAELPPSDLVSAKKDAEDAASHLAAVKVTLEQVQKSYGEAKAASDLADQHLADQRLLAEHRETYESLLTEKVTSQDVTQLGVLLEQSDKFVKQAREAVELGVKAREFDQRQTKAEMERRQGKDAQSIADLYRDAAHGIDGVLSDAVADLEVGLFVENGRLCVTTGRGTTPVGELSHGERWKLALDLGVRRVGERGVLAIPQEAWEGLDIETRSLIASQARYHNVTVLAAQADFGELRAEIYEDALA